MTKDVIMPRLHRATTQGWVVRWERAVGEELRTGDVIATVSVDKAAFDLESPHDGRLVEILVRPEQTVPAGTPIARIEVTG